MARHMTENVRLGLEVISVVLVGLAVEAEFSDREVVVVVREMLHQGNRQVAHIACRTQLFAIGQTGSVLEGRVGHSQHACLLGHNPGELPFGSAQCLGQNCRNIVRWLPNGATR